MSNHYHILGLIGMRRFRSALPCKLSFFLLFPNGEKATFRAETVAQRNGAIFAKHAFSRLVLMVRSSLAIGSGLIGPTRVYIGSGWVGPGVERFGPGRVAQVANPG